MNKRITALFILIIAIMLIWLDNIISFYSPLTGEKVLLTITVITAVMAIVTANIKKETALKLFFVLSIPLSGAMFVISIINILSPIWGCPMLIGSLIYTGLTIFGIFVKFDTLANHKKD